MKHYANRNHRKVFFFLFFSSFKTVSFFCLKTQLKTYTNYKNILGYTFMLHLSKLFQLRQIRSKLTTLLDHLPSPNPNPVSLTNVLNLFETLELLLKGLIFADFDWSWNNFWNRKKLKLFCHLMRAPPLPKLLNTYLGFLKLKTKTWA